MNDTRNLIRPGEKFERNGKTYETTGEYRPPKMGEPYVGESGGLLVVVFGTPGYSYPILRELPPPAPPRRVPTDADALHRPKCWVRDYEDVEWSSEPYTLFAVIEGAAFPYKAANSGGYSTGYRYCEIEDVDYGPVLHWRDATESDVGTTPDAVQLPNGFRKFGAIVQYPIVQGTKVLVEVGK